MGKQVVIKAMLAAGIMLTSTAGIGQSINAEEHTAQSLLERYKKDEIDGKKESESTWNVYNIDKESNQVKIELKGTYEIGNQKFNPKRHITIPKGKVNLKYIDHVVRYALVTSGLYSETNTPSGSIVVTMKDGGFYTLEVQKPLQSHRDNVEIDTEKIEKINFNIQVAK